MEKVYANIILKGKRQLTKSLIEFEMLSDRY